MSKKFSNKKRWPKQYIFSATMVIIMYQISMISLPTIMTKIASNVWPCTFHFYFKKHMNHLKN